MSGFWTSIERKDGGTTVQLPVSHEAAGAQAWPDQAPVRTPFPDVSLPARSYHAYLTEPRCADPAITLFCDWLQEVGRNGA
jgi:hypothetical protein